MLSSSLEEAFRKATEREKLHRSELQLTKAHLHESQEQYKNVQKENEKIRNKCSILTDELQLTKLHLQETRSELQLTKAHLHESQEQYKNVQKENEKIRNKCSILTDELQLTKLHIQEMQDQYQNVQKELDEFKIKRGTLQSNFETAKKYQNVQKELDEFKIKYCTLQSNFETAKKDNSILIKKVCGLKNELADRPTSMDCEAMESRIMKLKEKIRIQKEQIHHFAGSCDKAYAAKGLQNHNINIREPMRARLESMTKLEVALREMKEVLISIKNEKNEFIKQKEELTKLVAEKENKLINLTFSCTQLEHAWRVAEEGIKKRDAEIAQQKKQLRKKDLCYPEVLTPESIPDRSINSPNSSKSESEIKSPRELQKEEQICNKLRSRRKNKKMAEDEKPTTEEPVASHVDPDEKHFKTRHEVFDQHCSDKKSNSKINKLNDSTKDNLMEEVGKISEDSSDEIDKESLFQSCVLLNNTEERRTDIITTKTKINSENRILESTYKEEEEITKPKNLSIFEPERDLEVNIVDPTTNINECSVSLASNNEIDSSLTALESRCLEQSYHADLTAPEVSAGCELRLDLNKKEKDYINDTEHQIGLEKENTFSLPVQTHMCKSPEPDNVESVLGYFQNFLRPISPLPIKCDLEEIGHKEVKNENFSRIDMKKENSEMCEERFLHIKNDHCYTEIISSSERPLLSPSNCESKITKKVMSSDVLNSDEKHQQLLLVNELIVNGKNGKCTELMSGNNGNNVCYNLLDSQKTEIPSYIIEDVTKNDFESHLLGSSISFLNNLPPCLTKLELNPAKVDVHMDDIKYKVIEPGQDPMEVVKDRVKADSNVKDSKISEEKCNPSTLLTVNKASDVTNLVIKEGLNVNQIDSYVKKNESIILSGALVKESTEADGCEKFKLNVTEKVLSKKPGITKHTEILLPEPLTPSISIKKLKETSVLSDAPHVSLRTHGDRDNQDVNLSSTSAVSNCSVKPAHKNRTSSVGAQSRHESTSLLRSPNYNMRPLPVIDYRESRHKGTASPKDNCLEKSEVKRLKPNLPSPDQRSTKSPAFDHEIPKRSPHCTNYSLRQSIESPYTYDQVNERISGRQCTKSSNSKKKGAKEKCVGYNLMESRENRGLPPLEKPPKFNKPLPPELPLTIEIKENEEAFDDAMNKSFKTQNAGDLLKIGNLNLTNLTPVFSSKISLVDKFKRVYTHKHNKRSKSKPTDVMGGIKRIVNIPDPDIIQIEAKLDTTCDYETLLTDCDPHKNPSLSFLCGYLSPVLINVPPKEKPKNEYKQTVEKKERNKRIIKRLTLKKASVKKRNAYLAKLYHRMLKSKLKIAELTWEERIFFSTYEEKLKTLREKIKTNEKILFERTSNSSKNKQSTEVSFESTNSFLKSDSQEKIQFKDTKNNSGAHECPIKKRKTLCEICDQLQKDIKKDCAAHECSVKKPKTVCKTYDQLQSVNEEQNEKMKLPTLDHKTQEYEEEKCIIISDEDEDCLMIDLNEAESEMVSSVNEEDSDPISPKKEKLLEPDSFKDKPNKSKSSSLSYDLNSVQKPKITVCTFEKSSLNDSLKGFQNFPGFRSRPTMPIYVNEEPKKTNLDFSQWQNRVLPLTSSSIGPDQEQPDMELTQSHKTDFLPKFYNEVLPEESVKKSKVEKIDEVPSNIGTEFKFPDFPHWKQKTLEKMIPQGVKVEVGSNLLRTAADHHKKELIRYLSLNLKEKRKPHPPVKSQKEIVDALDSYISDVVKSDDMVQDIVEKILPFTASEIIKSLSTVLTEVVNRSYLPNTNPLRKQNEWIFSLHITNKPVTQDPSSRFHDKIFILLILLKAVHDRKTGGDFLSEVMTAVERKLLGGDVSEEPAVPMTVGKSKVKTLTGYCTDIYLAYLYSAVAQLTGCLRRVRKFAFDILYCFNKKSLVVLHPILATYKIFLPVRPIEKYLHDPIGLVMIRALTVTPRDGCKKTSKSFLDSRIDILHSYMWRHYRFNAETTNRDILFDMFLTQLCRYDVHEALVLLTKREERQWFVKRPFRDLMAVVQRWRDGSGDINNAVAAMNALGCILRSYQTCNIQSELEPFFQLIHTVLMDESAPDSVKEVMAVNLCRLSRLNYDACITLLAGWKPTHISQDLIDKVLVDFLTGNRKAWLPKLWL